MTTRSHQTVRLSRGKHESPEEGACVMELASMLAGERFSDHPLSVCPVIGEFLRTYNDRLDDERRQDLYRYAAAVVGTRGSRAVERRRARRCIEVANAISRRWLALPLFGRRTWAAAYAASVLAQRCDEAAHARALALVDELLADGSPGGRPPTRRADHLPAEPEPDSAVAG